jgi:HlyD family secretion protein
MGAAALALSIAMLALWAWRAPAPLPPGFAVSPGRLEAEELHVATKLPGRVFEVLVDEGDAVGAGQVLVRMDTQALAADYAAASASIAEAEKRLRAARALVAKRESECDLAQREVGRAGALFERGAGTEQELDLRRSRLRAARAAFESAAASVENAEAALAAAAAMRRRVEADLVDSALRAPRAARVEYRLVESGEVLPAGGRALTLIDLDDVTMTLFLPAREAGRVRIGADARILIDAQPNAPIPARVSFVASEAQFTPRQVETASEREKLVFRVELRVLPGHGAALNPGMPGRAWIRLDEGAPWPPNLQ